LIAYKTKVELTKKCDEYIMILKDINKININNDINIKDKEKESTLTHNTICISCLKNCHEPCYLEYKGNYDPHIRNCYAMTNDYCECGCAYSFHRHFNFKYIGNEKGISLKTKYNLWVLNNSELQQKLEEIRMDLKIEINKLINQYQQYIEFGFKDYLMAYINLISELIKLDKDNPDLIELKNKYENYLNKLIK